MEPWTEVVAEEGDRVRNAATVLARLDALELKIDGVHDKLREIVAHCRQQSIVQRGATLDPLEDIEEMDTLVARITNMALRQHVPIPFRRDGARG